MNDFLIYEDIAKRTGGDIYIGVVGPVRSGKSTFIKRFLETAVLPRIQSEHERARTRDEMPQSAGGRTVMTTEPKFIPDEAVEVSLGNGSNFRVKLVDCVGYLIPGAETVSEDGAPRMVQTPWSDAPIPFEEAAEIGTGKVIREHSTIGMLVTSDGSFGEIPRASYEAAEARIASELKEIGKPFVVVMNSAHPSDPASEALAITLEEKYGAPVALVSCLELNEEDVGGILAMVLSEFPVKEIALRLPSWLPALEGDSWLVQAVTEASSSAGRIRKMGQVKEIFAESFSRSLDEAVGKNTGVKEPATVRVERLDMGAGTATVSFELPREVYFRVISEATDMDIADDKALLSTLCRLADVKKDYERFSAAIDEVEEKGYGIVMPSVEDMKLEEPVIVKQPGGYGVRLRASAPSIHLIKAGIETELSPIVGTEQQSEDLVRTLLADFSDDPKKIWESNLFGKSLYDLVNEGLHTKLSHMPEDARDKLGETLSRIINEGSSGLVCIIL